MDLVDKIKELASRIPKQLDYINTEEATKNALIMPFINALGYDVFNPLEVLPEFNADVGTKKGEKVDYAIKKDNSIVMLIECKWCGCDLNKEHATQLYRYFSVTETRFGILTNGIVYKFYSDIEEKNKMDLKPFFEFDILNFEELQLDELKKFTKSSFDLEDILTTASTLKYTGAIKKIFGDEISNPSDEFVKFFVSQAYSGLKTQAIIVQFSKIVKDALNQFVREKINDRLKSALNDVRDQVAEDAEVVKNEENDEEKSASSEEEAEAYHIVKAIVRDIIDVNRVFIREAKSYCSVLLDDNNRKPICRFHFKSAKKKYLGTFCQKEETKHSVNNVNDIYSLSEDIKATISEFLEAELADNSNEVDPKQIEES